MFVLLEFYCFKKNCFYLKNKKLVTNNYNSVYMDLITYFKLIIYSHSLSGNIFLLELHYLVPHEGHAVANLVMFTRTHHYFVLILVHVLEIEGRASCLQSMGCTACQSLPRPPPGPLHVCQGQGSGPASGSPAHQRLSLASGEVTVSQMALPVELCNTVLSSLSLAILKIFLHVSLTFSFRERLCKM